MKPWLLICLLPTLAIADNCAEVYGEKTCKNMDVANNLSQTQPKYYRYRKWMSLSIEEREKRNKAASCQMMHGKNCLYDQEGNVTGADVPAVKRIRY